MSRTIADDHERDVIELEAEIGVPFLFGGQQYIGIKRQTRIGLEMADAGYNKRRRMDFSVRLSQFGATNPPESKDTITIDDLTWRVGEEVEHLSLIHI